jgi:hypothetical protein
MTSVLRWQYTTAAHKNYSTRPSTLHTPPLRQGHYANAQTQSLVLVVYIHLPHWLVTTQVCPGYSSTTRTPCAGPS